MFSFKNLKKFILNIFHRLENISEKIFKKKTLQEKKVIEKEFTDYKTVNFNNMVNKIFNQYSGSVPSSFKYKIIKNQGHILPIFELKNISTQLPYSIIIPLYTIFDFIKNSEMLKNQAGNQGYLNCKVEIVFISIEDEVKQKHVKILCNNNYKSVYFFQNILLIRNFIFSSLFKLLNNYTMDKLLSLKIMLI